MVPWKKSCRTKNPRKNSPLEKWSPLKKSPEFYRGPFFQGFFSRGPFFRGSFSKGPFFWEFFFLGTIFPGTFFPGTIFLGIFPRGPFFQGPSSKGPFFREPFFRVPKRHCVQCSLMINLRYNYNTEGLPSDYPR